MSRRISLQARIDDFLAERRRLGFELRSWDSLLSGFARYVASRHHRGALTVELMADWARHDKGNRETPGTWARRLERVRLFARYLSQFEPDTEVPDESIFGPVSFLSNDCLKLVFSAMLDGSHVDFSRCGQYVADKS